MLDTVAPFYRSSWLWKYGVLLITKTITGKTMRKRELTIHRLYEPNRLSDKYLANAYEQLLRYLVKTSSEMEVEKNDKCEFLCKSIIRETSTGEYNRESDYRT
ncbi:hypothetical protein [Wolbachia endosymbiont of Pentidionis agamae]|uniref:hypothetical protein n=1 Tax=Wolbachia endosymbiont of Pentidionis agamae TaxID=3110435 RepID=UPI002FD2AED5